MTDLTQALAVGRDDTRRFSVALIDLEKAYNNALAADVDVVSAMWMNLSMDCAKVSNDLIPRADADLAVALMVERAADIVGMCDQVGADAEGPVRALAPASALAELQALRAERDDAVASQFITRVERDGAEDHATETADELRQVRARAEAAEAELVTLRAQVERLTGALGRAQRALKPFADRVFNDNGDCTISDTHTLTPPDYWNAQSAERIALAALTEGAAP